MNIPYNRDREIRMHARTNKISVAAIVLAAGKGERFGKDQPKQFRKISGKEMYRYSVESLLRHPRVHEVILVVPENRLSGMLQAARGIDPERMKVVAGKDTRQGSSRAGLHAVSARISHVLIHDAARPRFSRKLLNRILDALLQADAVVPAIDVTDTLVRLERQGGVDAFPDRLCYKRLQTPQGFRLSVIREAHERAMNDAAGIRATDDAGLVHHYQLATVLLVPGELGNIKITTPEDLEGFKKSWRVG